MPPAHQPKAPARALDAVLRARRRWALRRPAGKGHIGPSAAAARGGAGAALHPLCGAGLNRIQREELRPAPSLALRANVACARPKWPRVRRLNLPRDSITMWVRPRSGPDRHRSAVPPPRGDRDESFHRPPRLSARPALLLPAALAPSAAQVSAAGFRPPAVPLVTIDPYTSCWSMADRLYDEWPKHWTGQAARHVRHHPGRRQAAAVHGHAAPKFPTRSSSNRSRSGDADRFIDFAGAGVDLTVTFTSPLLMDDLDLLSRPASYVTFSVESDDGKPHEVQVYFDATAEWAVNTPDQLVEWDRPLVENLAVMSAGHDDQPVLAAKGDDRRIDWGWLLVAAADRERPKRRSRPTRWPGRPSPRPARRSKRTTTRMPRRRRRSLAGAVGGDGFGQRRRRAGRRGI